MISYECKKTIRKSLPNYMNGKLATIAHSLYIAHCKLSTDSHTCHLNTINDIR